VPSQGATALARKLPPNLIEKAFSRSLDLINPLRDLERTPSTVRRARQRACPSEVYGSGAAVSPWAIAPTASLGLFRSPYAGQKAFEHAPMGGLMCCACR